MIKKLYCTILLIFVFSSTLLANDFYPSNVIPANGAVFEMGSPIPIMFSICLAHNFPAFGFEWYVDISITDGSKEIHQQTIAGFGANGPACFPINDAEAFIPPHPGTYNLIITVHYDQEINSENDTYAGTFTVEPPFMDIAIQQVLVPTLEDIYYENSSSIQFKLILANNGDVDVSPEQWNIKIDFTIGDEIILDWDLWYTLPGDFEIPGNVTIPANSTIEWTAPAIWPVTQISGIYFLIRNLGFNDADFDNNLKTQEIIVFSKPPIIENFFPGNGATDIPYSPPPAITWENGDTPITEQAMEIKLGDNFIVSQTIPFDATSFIPPNDLLPSSHYEWYLAQTNPSGTTISGPFDFFTSDPLPPSPFGFQFEINKVNNEHYTSDPIGIITTTFNPGEQGTYINVFAHNLNSDMSSQIIDNLFLPPSTDANTPTELSTNFDFTTLAPPPYSTPFNTVITIYTSDGPVVYPFPPSTLTDTRTATVNEFFIDAIGVEVPETQNFEITPVSRNGYTIGDPQINYRYRSTAPNLDLDDSQHGDTETFAGDLNACVPTATANSLKWMEQTYTDFNLPADMDLRKTMETLSGLMKRERNKGTPTENMIQGKLDFMEQFKLPVEVKFQAFYVDGNIASTSGNSLARNFNTSDKKPTWEFLKKMMKDGEDVEMNYTWKDPSDNEWYAHSVNVTGIEESESGVKKITFKHDARQSSTGGLIEEVHQVVEANGWLRFGAHNENFIREVIVESPIVPEGRETAAWLNELFANGGSLKITSPASAVNEFVEVIINQNVVDLQNYRLSIYDGSGMIISEVELNDFTAGAEQDSFKVYSYEFNGDVIPDVKGGAAISYSGSPITGSFYSWGGTITAVNGDYLGLTSVDIGITPTPGNSIALTGSGTEYNSFSWVINPNPSPGSFNPSQEVPVELVSFAASVENNKVLLKWTTATETNNSGFEIQRREEFSGQWIKISFVEGAGNSTSARDYSYADQVITPGKYSYRLKQIDFNGTFSYSQIVNVDVSVPKEFSLAQNYPNPFNPNTVIEFAVPVDAMVNISVYNILGENIGTILNEYVKAGVHKIDFNADNLRSGVYFYRMQAVDKVFTRKMTLIK